jgi:hypothetical protein
VSRGAGRLERLVRQKLDHPAGMALRTLAAGAYAVAPDAVTRAQLISVRQVLSRLKARGEIVDSAGPGGAKLWRTINAAEYDARRQAEEDARDRANQRRRERREARGWEDWLRRRVRVSDPEQAILERAAKLMAMLGSDQPGERDNAARLLERLRQQHKLDWTDFLTRRK